MIFDFLGPPSEDYSNDTGRIVLWVRPGQIFTQVEGLADLDLVHVLTKWGYRIDTGHGENLIFHDLRLLESYAPGVRDYLVQSTKNLSSSKVFFFCLDRASSTWA